MPTKTSWAPCPNCPHDQYEHDEHGCTHTDIVRDQFGTETHETCPCTRPHPMLTGDGYSHPPLTEDEAKAYRPPAWALITKER
jgi:hypothetical protein